MNATKRTLDGEGESPKRKRKAKDRDQAFEGGFVLSSSLLESGSQRANKRRQLNELRDWMKQSDRKGPAIGTRDERSQTTARERKKGD